MPRYANLAIIGAGIAGLSCATALRQAGLAVTVFEKSRAPAGRMSTRRADDWQCDHGAQYFTAPDAAFRAEVARWQAAGVASLWQPTLAVIGDAALHNTSASLERFVGTPRMTAPARWLASTLSIKAERTITALQRHGAHWQLHCAEEGLIESTFDAVLLAVPAPQVVPLLAEPAPLLAELARGANMRGCWALMLRFAARVELPFDAAFVNAGPLRWIARDSAKPGRTGPETWLLHASAAWSEAHLEASAESVTTSLLAAFSACGGPTPEAATAHRWRYADTMPPLEAGCAWDPATKLGLCGDWLNGGRVEGAWLSGRKLASELLQANVN